MTTRRLTLSLLAATSIIGLSSAAMAQDWMTGPTQARGPYVEAVGGVTWTESVDSDAGTGTAQGPLSGRSFETSFDTGWAAGGRIGYGLQNGLRFEFEGTYRNNEAGSASVSPGLAGLTNGDGDGEIQSVALMVNGMYDWRNSSRFTPYIGVGGGALWVRQDTTIPVSYNGVTQRNYDIHHEEWVPAVQGIAGVSIGITPAIAATVDYRYIRGFDVTSSNGYGVETSNDYSNHTVFVGLRYTFGAPAVVAQPEPTPPAPPPTAAEQIYLVFFDFDRSNLTPEGREVVSQVATRAMQPGAGVQQIQVSGHTDRAGSNQYNVGLSQRRAETVRRGLIERGVPANEIVTRWFGETQNRVPTPDGVREPQNRRVEIVLM